MIVRDAAGARDLALHAAHDSFEGEGPVVEPVNATVDQQAGGEERCSEIL